jgi:hypothetical protein
VMLQWIGFKHDGLCCHSRLHFQAQVSGQISSAYYGVECIAPD